MPVTYLDVPDWLDIDKKRRLVKRMYDALHDAYSFPDGNRARPVRCRYPGRPMPDTSPSGATARARAFGGELVRVHQWLRDELARIHDQLDGGEDLLPLQAHCVAFCVALTSHHTSEGVRREIDGLSAILESHFRWEEKSIVEALNTLGTARSTEELFGTM